LGLPLFSSEAFVLSSLHFVVASFFIGDLCFEPMNEGCNYAPSFMALAYLAYQLLSNTELALLAILIMVINVLTNEAYIIASGLQGLCLIKILMPSRASTMRKRVWALKVNARNEI
jgi:hypothetical protein